MNSERTHRTAWIGLGFVLLLALAAASALGGGFLGHAPLLGYGGRPFVGGAPWFWGFGVIGLFLRVVVWGGLIMLLVSLFRRRSRWSPMNSDRWEPSPLEILQRRYAAGEITREQFDEMRRVLESTAPAG
jgi:putative membrane protein